MDPGGRRRKLPQVACDAFSSSRSVQVRNSSIPAVLISCVSKKGKFNKVNVRNKASAMGEASGLTRIPTRRYRIPQTKTKPDLIETGHISIGSKVKLGEKEGVLRYVGNVAFAEGIWAGLELALPLGKNDGRVQGVRYFQCPPQCGLMAPLSKIQPLDQEDSSSGPYSILFLNETKIHETFNLNQTVIQEDNKKSKRLSELFSPVQNSTEVKRRKTTKKPLRKVVLENSSSFANLPQSTPKKGSQEEEEESLGLLSESVLDGFLQLDKDVVLMENKDESSTLIEENLENTVKVKRDSLERMESLASSMEDVASKTVDVSGTDLSLGILDVNMLSHLSFPNDGLGLQFENKYFNRLDQTPSPEELPLDTVPVLAEADLKQGKVKGNTFVASITSVTSLDTGYQGDGEMSRPGSRGTNSPTKRPARPQPRRADPMTDSDFYTESDADNHDDNHKGDRKAQVIDGTLYGVDPQAAADIYVNNRENMDSSGIFTDLENAVVEVDLGVENMDVSPSDTTRTISENSQRVEVKKDEVKEEKKVVKEEKKVVTRGKPNYKNVQSRVFSNINVNIKEDKEKKDKQNVKVSPGNKMRRLRSRVNAVGGKGQPVGSNNSSFSDISGQTGKKIVAASKKKEALQVTQVLTASKLSPRQQAQAQVSSENKKNIGLTQNAVKSAKKPSPLPKEKTATRPRVPKVAGKGAVKDGRNASAPRTGLQVQAKAAPKAPPVAEALAVLVQHLVFNVEAFQVPILKRELNRKRLEVEEISLKCQQFEEALLEERRNHQKVLEDERVRFREDILELTEKHKELVSELNNRHAEVEKQLLEDKENVNNSLDKQHQDQLTKLRFEFTKLQRTHEESLDILREENDAIREQIDEKNEEIERGKRENSKLKEEFHNNVVKFKQNLGSLSEENKSLREELQHMQKQLENLSCLEEENEALKKDNERLLGYDEKNIGMLEVQSLKTVLELRQNEIQELRKALAEATRKADYLVGAEEKVKVLNARCEDLELQLKQKAEFQQSISLSNQKISERLKEEQNQKRRLSQLNEELQWKLQQSKEVISKVFEQTEDSSFGRSFFTSSFNEKHSSPKMQLERARSFKDCTYNGFARRKKEDEGQSSPKVKGVVEKSDSVSYVLDLDESPDVVASRIVRRSFRNSTPPKTTPTKSPCNKRPRIRSCSSSGGVFGCNGDFRSSTPNSSAVTLAGDLEIEEDDLEMQLPALPSELGGEGKALPMPSRLAGEDPVSDSNSEDESTSSSQL